jgi:hypothetical protein
VCVREKDVVKKYTKVLIYFVLVHGAARLSTEERKYLLDILHLTVLMVKMVMKLTVLVVIFVMIQLKSPLKYPANIS